MPSGVWDLLVQFGRHGLTNCPACNAHIGAFAPPQVAGAYRSEAVVVQAMCELYSRMMATMGMLMRPLLPQLLHELARTFPSTPVVGVLSTLRDAIEQYGRQYDDELHDTLLFVMSELVNFFCTWLSSTKEPEVRPMATDGD